jgi:CheY-like chemotaxis protein
MTGSPEKEAPPQFDSRVELLRLKCKKAALHIQERLNEDLPVLLNRECECTVGEISFLTEQELRELPTRPNDFWLVLREGERAHFQIHFPFAVGIALSGLLLVMADSRIRERIAEQELIQEDLDVLMEIGNQLRGGLMRSLRKIAYRDVHLALGGLLQAPQPPETLPSGLACLYPVTIRIPRLLSDRFEIVADLGGLAHIFGVAMDKASLEQLLSEGETSDESPGGEGPRGQAIVIGSSCEADVLRRILSLLGYQIVQVRDVQTLAEELREGAIRVIAIDVEDDPAKPLRLVQLLRSFNRECPILLGARAWTKEQLFAGVRAGASGFLIKPYTLEAVRERLLPRESTPAPEPAAAPPSSL